MEDETRFEEQLDAQPQPAYSKGRKIWLEIKDILTGVAFPFILTLVLSSTVIRYAGYKADLAISIVACVGGEAMLIAALVMFGRYNGAAAYKKNLLHEQKRELGSQDERVGYRTGEYALWKGVVIGAVLCIPFLVFQTIELCAPNVVCQFCLNYICAWAYYPLSYAGENLEGLNYICVIIPIAAHTVGYYLGKIKQIKVQKQLEETNAKKKGRKK